MANIKSTRSSVITKVLSILSLTSLLAAQIALSTTSLSAQEEPVRQDEQAVMSTHLYQELTVAEEPVSFLVVLQDQVDAAQVLATPALRAASRETRATSLYRELTTRARVSQAPLRAWLEQAGIPYRAFYLINMIEVQGDLTVATALQKRPEVDRLVANPLVTNALAVAAADRAMTWLQALPSVAKDEAEATLVTPYGLNYTNATDVWALGYRGEGIVIASQDTGVEWDHPALQAAYRGFTDTMTATITTTVSSTVSPSGGMTGTVNHIYNWFDAWELVGRPFRCVQDAQIPCDDNGHGTHTVGTMLGDASLAGETVLGMAPEAEWIGCRNMNRGFGTPASYTACFEFFLAPYPQGGDPFTDGRPELAPHIINNSWGCPPDEGCDANSLRQVVETVRAAGQMVVSSAGNSGSGCFSVQNPIAIHDATFSVGAHDSNGTIASFSSRGPVSADGSGRLKPDISAPGVAVYSATVNRGYQFNQGTSMASPHVAGAVALLWSAVPTLIGDIDMTEQVLIKSATDVPANQCGEGGTPVVPNNTYGYGRLDILAAVNMAQAPGSLAIAVNDDNGTLLTEQTVMVTDSLTGYQYEVTTAFNGIARLPRLYAGNYLVEIPDDSASAQSVAVANNVASQVQVTKTMTTSTIAPIYLPLIVR